MTTDFMMDDLKRELETLFAGEDFPAASGERKPLTVYLDGLPIEEADDEDIESGEAARAPFAILKYVSGEISESEETSTVAIVLCNHDESGTFGGARSLRHQIHLIKHRFLRHPYFTKYEVQTPINIVAQDPEEYWPYIYGGVELIIKAPWTEREDELV